MVATGSAKTLKGVCEVSLPGYHNDTNEVWDMFNVRIYWLCWIRTRSRVGTLAKRAVRCGAAGGWCLHRHPGAGRRLAEPPADMAVTHNRMA
jgi:hypothetical protein